MERNNIIKRSGMLLLSVMVMLAMCTAAAFADEGGSTVSVQITIGEHGKVNDHTTGYTETVNSGENLVLNCQADEGYVIGTILVNDAELEDEDLQGISGQRTGNLTLDGLTTDLTVEVRFAETSGGTDAPAAGSAGSEDTEGNAGTDDTEGGLDDEGEGGLSDEDPDPEGTEDEAGDTVPDTQGDGDGPGSLSTGDDEAGEIDLDDSGQSGGEEDQPGQENGGEVGGEGTGNEDGMNQQEPDSEQTADQSDEKNEEGSGASVRRSEKAEQDTSGKAVSEGKGDSNTDTYYSDNTPRTGDHAFPVPVILAMLGSLCMLAGIAARQIWKKRNASM